MMADEIRPWYRNQGLKQKQAAQLLGIHVATLQKYEKGQLATPPAIALACFAITILRLPLQFQVDGFEGLQAAIQEQLSGDSKSESPRLAAGAS